MALITNSGHWSYTINRQSHINILIQLGNNCEHNFKIILYLVQYLKLLVHSFPNRTQMCMITYTNHNDYWDCIRSYSVLILSSSGRLRVKEEYLVPAITAETPLEYIIPTTTEAGACTTALVDFLTYTQ